jgi:DNA repair exonuclease SbcCD nuclease subunit
MKVDAIITSDWHIRDSVPVCRQDDYFQTMLGKIKWVSDLQQEHDCPVLHAGDLFHKYEPKSKVLGYLMTRMPKQFYTIPGNHDLKNHNIELIEQGGITVLKEADKIKVLSNSIYESNAFNFSITGIFYGFISNLKLLGLDTTDVLMCHEMIYQQPEHWMKNNGSQALSFLKKHKGYQLIVTGHNHKPFTAQHEGRLLVNPGSLMRMTADQKDYKPRVYLWNKESNTIKIEYIPIDKEAVQTVYLEKTKERDHRMESFIDRLQSSTEVGLSFEKNLENYLANNRVRNSVKDVIFECIGEEL